MHSAEDFGPKADGVKVWRSSGMTAVLHISAPTVEYIVDLVEELRAQDKAHTLVAVNCAWTSGRDVGQLWQRCVATACAQCCQHSGRFSATCATCCVLREHSKREHV